MRWGSQAGGYGIATLRFSTSPPIIHNLQVFVANVSVSMLASAGPGGVLGPMHFHNFPQGGPNFFVQQLPGTYYNYGKHFFFELKEWKMGSPGNRRDLPPSFVLQEILDGNVYLGIHTNEIKCFDAPNDSCAAPGTAIAGDVSVN